MNVKQKDSLTPENPRYVLDGGALLYRIPWTRGSSFSTILQTYADYVNKCFSGSVIVFDRYEEVLTKDMAHRRHSKRKKGMIISFNEEMSPSVTKDVFLNDTTNKQCFIALLGDKLYKNNCTVYYAKSDADFLIVQKAVETEVRLSVFVASSRVAMISCVV